MYVDSSTFRLRGLLKFSMPFLSGGFWKVGVRTFGKVGFDEKRADASNSRGSRSEMAEDGLPLVLLLNVLYRTQDFTALVQIFIIAAE